MTYDYASLFELEIRPRRRAQACIFGRAAAVLVWGGLFLVRPRLARAIWRERRP
jgi:hypothetical protein